MRRRRLRSAIAGVLLVTAACSSTDVDVDGAATTAAPDTTTTLATTTTTDLTIEDILGEFDPDQIPLEQQIPGLIPDITRPELAPVDGVWFSMFLRQRGGPVDQLALTTEGFLVGIGDRGVYGGPDSSWQRRLTDEGVDRTLALVREAGEVSYDGTCCTDPPTGLAEALLAPSFLAEHAGPPEPWIPATLTVFVQPPDIRAAGDPGPPITWPLARRLVGDHDGSADIPYTTDAPYHCLAGDEAATVWGLLGGGRNTAWLPAEDPTGRYLLRVDVQWPGYRLYGDPCG